MINGGTLPASAAPGQRRNFSKTHLANGYLAIAYQVEFAFLGQNAAGRGGRLLPASPSRAYRSACR